jgi:hypothetical protein
MNEMMTLELARERMPPIWVIYERPTDFPEHFVVRVWWGETPEPVACLAATLFEARDLAIEAGACMRMERSEKDAPCIVETWI